MDIYPWKSGRWPSTWPAFSRRDLVLAVASAFKGINAQYSGGTSKNQNCGLQLWPPKGGGLLRTVEPGSWVASSMPNPLETYVYTLCLLTHISTEKWIPHLKTSPTNREGASDIWRHSIGWVPARMQMPSTHTSFQPRCLTVAFRPLLSSLHTHAQAWFEVCWKPKTRSRWSRSLGLDQTDWNDQIGQVITSNDQFWGSFWYPKFDPSFTNIVAAKSLTKDHYPSGWGYNHPSRDSGIYLLFLWPMNMRMNHSITYLSMAMEHGQLLGNPPFKSSRVGPQKWNITTIYHNPPPRC